MFSIESRRDRTDDRSTLSAPEDLPILEALVRRWIRSRARPDVVLIDPDGGGTLHLDQVLTRLRDSSAVLGAECARRLGLPRDATVGDAARSLLFARYHPGGPRCASFRAASYFLSRLARIDFEVEQQEPPTHPHQQRSKAEPATRPVDLAAVEQRSDRGSRGEVRQHAVR